MKRNRILIYTLIFIILVIVVCFIILFVRNLNKPATILTSDCVKAGETSNILQLDQKGGCCGGLNPIQVIDIPLTGNWTCEELSNAVGGEVVCSACGNGHCETWENKCNCQEDCK